MFKKIFLFFLLLTTPVFSQSETEVSIPELNELSIPADGDWLYIIDVSDTTDGSTGTGKKIQVENLLGGDVGGGGGAAPVINTFINNKNTVEVGTTITSTDLDWTITGTVTTQSLDEGIGSISAALREYTDPADYTATKTYTLTASNSGGSDTADSTVNFRSKIYYGVSSATTLSGNDAAIIALTSEFATTRVKSVENLVSAAQRIHFLYPASFGAATFTINTIPFNDMTLEVISHTNASGGSVSYNHYYTNNILTGTYDLEVD